MKRRILLVDDEVAVLLTLKAVLEISGFDVDTAASGREGRHKLRASQYHMVITDMRMEHDEAGAEVIKAAREASYRPVVALLTAFPVAEEDWQGMGADKMLVKPMQTRLLLQQIEKMLEAHAGKADAGGQSAAVGAAPRAAAKATGTKARTKRVVRKSVRAARKPAAKAKVAKKK